MEDGLVRNLHAGGAGRRLTGVQVAVPAREVAGGDVQADAVPGPEDVTGRPEVDLVLVGPARCDRRGRLAGPHAPVPGAQDAVGRIEGAAVGVNVAEQGAD